MSQRIRRFPVKWFAAIVLLACTLPLRAWGAGPAGSEFQVNTFTSNFQRYPAVAADSAGNFVVVWEGNYGQDGDSNGVFGQRFNSAGAALGSEFQANTYVTNDQQDAAVAADSAGNFVVVWESETHPGDIGYGIFGQRFDSTGAALGGEFHANTYTTTHQFDPAVAADSAGNFVVVWTGQQDYGSSNGIFGQRFDSTGATLGSEFQVNTYITGSQESSAVAADSAGNFVVVWQTLFQDGSGRGIFGKRYNSAGNPLGGEFQVNTYTTGDQVYPAVAVDGAGNIVVVWEIYGEDVHGQRYDSAGVALGSEFQANTNTTNSAQYPAVGADGAGNFVVAWRSNDFFSNGVFGRHFDSTGTAVGGEFRLNTYTTAHQSYPAVVGGTGGDFLVVWTSDNQDGSDEGIFGQRLCTVVTCTNGDGCCPGACNPGNDDDCTTTSTTSTTSSTSTTMSSSTTTTSSSTSTTILPPTDLLPGRITIIRPGTLAKFVAKPPTGDTFALPTANPVAAGGSLRIFDTGATAGDDTYTLPLGASWKGLGNPAGSKGYKYKGAGTPADPCKVVLVKEKVIKGVCLGSGVTLTPPFTGDVAIVLSLGTTDRYCAQFGGETVKTDATVEKRKNAPAPAACP
jgi:hypothetical protein